MYNIPSSKGNENFMQIKTKCLFLLEQFTTIISRCYPLSMVGKTWGVQYFIEIIVQKGPYILTATINDSI